MDDEAGAVQEDKPEARPGKILVVDADASACAKLAELLHAEGYEVETAADGVHALHKLNHFAPDPLLTDLQVQGLDGLALLRRALEIDFGPAVIMMTGDGAIETAVTAMRAGATDYLSKPLNLEELGILIERALERRALSSEMRHLKEQLATRDRSETIVGTTEPMLRLHETIMQVAPSRATVLITGESGTGKGLVAATIHRHSNRSERPFIKLHCAALTESLLESELFGHERGAFTGAYTRRDGRIKQADGGTLFLDEIGEISPATQIKLLRFLQEREFEMVGGKETIKVDVRIIAATNRELTKDVQEGRFREDLYCRLNVVSIETPALRARPADIPLLALRLLRKYAEENGKAIATVSETALLQLMQYRWPGNVRELENAIERAVVLCRSLEIRPRDLPFHIGPPAGSDKDGMPSVPGATLAQLERYAILRTLEHTGGSTARAAEILGISSRIIQYRLREYSTPAH